ncbi:MAG: hypothetical protein BroJett011_16350 [Chloroflexota bacterium]|nr:MAG: hypothetical protein BroJett011_16350 [Chloroflexota bacterium]
MEDSCLRWIGFLFQPIWYVASVSCLAGLTYFLHLGWWLTALVALVWGMGLVWQVFTEDQGGAGEEEQPQRWLAQARRYQARINQALKHSPNRNHSGYGPPLAAQVDAWVETIQDLVQRLAVLRRDDFIRQELAAVPLAVAALEAQLARTSDTALRAQVEHTLANRRSQLVLLQGLEASMGQAEVQIEHTLALLSTVYSQILAGQSVSYVADYGRFLAGVDEEVRRLQDQLEALREVRGVSIC